MQHKPIKTIFVCEFITAGGLNQQDIPESLLQQGRMMRDALLNDLEALPYEVSTTYDARLTIPSYVNKALSVQAYDDVWQIWEAEMKAVDAVWLIAPESEGALMTLTDLAAQHKKVILGCGLTALQITASKLQTYQALDQAGVSTIPTYLLQDWPSDACYPCLVKPDDGAGCEDTLIFDNAMDLQLWMEGDIHLGAVVIQPFITGLHGSITCVMHQGKAVVLSCNNQVIEINNQQLYYQGSVINGLQSYWAVFSDVASMIAKVIPGLNGYVGIDVIIEPETNKVVVVEINPRLTVSYCGLSETIACNPAEIIINTLMQTGDAMPAIQKQPVDLYMGSRDG